jgi:hypothetical protein
MHSRFLSLTLLCTIFLSLFSCTEDDIQPDTVPSSSIGTLSMNTDQESWTDAGVSVRDHSGAVLSLSALSQQGGAMELGGILFTGMGTYTFENSTLGLWLMSPDTLNPDLIYSSFNGVENHASGSLVMTNHDLSANTLSGTFDFYLYNIQDVTDSIHLFGSFEEVQVKSVSSELQVMSASIDGAPFVHDYVVTEIVGNTVYLHMVKDIRKRVIIRIERFNLSAQTYAMNAISLPLGITYTNVYQEYNQAISGTAEVSIHYSGSMASSTPGSTMCTYSVVNGDFGTTDPVQISGQFDVEYEF